MRLAPSLLVAILLAGCAHAPAPQAHRREPLSISDGSTRVLVRYAPEDDEVAPRVQRALRLALPMASRWGALPPRVIVTIHPTHAALEAAAHRPDRAWLRAWARRDSVEVQSPRSWSRGGATDAELTQILAHELTHCALYQALGSDPRRARSVPLWFWEGMATTTAGERFSTVHPASGGSRTVDAVLHDADAPLAYASAHHAFRSLLRTQGDGRVRQLLARVREGAEFPDAFHEVMGIRLDVFERELEGEARQERTRG